jgi:hypothetical protein
VQFFPAGTFVLEQGEPPGALYLVLSGSVDIIHESDDGARTLVATSGPGCFVGEDGLASGQPRNAHVVAATSVTCFVLSPVIASAAAARGPRSATDHASLASEPDSDPAGCLRVDVTRFALQKMQALACHRSQYALDADMFPRGLVEAIFGVEFFRQVG